MEPPVALGRRNTRFRYRTGPLRVRPPRRSSSRAASSVRGRVGGRLWCVLRTLREGACPGCALLQCVRCPSAPRRIHRSRRATAGYPDIGSSNGWERHSRQPRRIGSVGGLPGAGGARYSRVARASQGRERTRAGSRRQIPRSARVTGRGRRLASDAGRTSPGGGSAVAEGRACDATGLFRTTPGRRRALA